MCKENKVPALLFAQNNYIEKEIFSTSVFPKGIDSSPSIHEDAFGSQGGSVLTRDAVPQNGCQSEAVVLRKS